MRFDFITKAYMFALCNFHIVCLMHRAKLRVVCINAVASVFEEGSGTSPWPLRLCVCVCIVFAAPSIEDCKVDAIVIGSTGESH